MMEQQSLYKTHFPVPPPPSEDENESINRLRKCLSIKKTDSNRRESRGEVFPSLLQTLSPELAVELKYFTFDSKKHDPKRNYRWRDILASFCSRLRSIRLLKEQIKDDIKMNYNQTFSSTSSPRKTKDRKLQFFFMVFCVIHIQGMGHKLKEQLMEFIQWRVDSRSAKSDRSSKDVQFDNTYLLEMLHIFRKVELCGDPMDLPRIIRLYR